MKQITPIKAQSLLELSNNTLDSKDYYIEGRNLFSDQPYIYTAYQVDCLGYEWVEVRTYTCGEVKYFASK